MLRPETVVHLLQPRVKIPAVNQNLPYQQEVVEPSEAFGNSAYRHQLLLWGELSAAARDVEPTMAALLLIVGVVGVVIPVARAAPAAVTLAALAALLAA